MGTLSNKQLKELGFNLLPIVTDECDDGFSYRVAEIKNKHSLLEVINEYRNGKLTNQYTNVEICANSIKNASVEFLTEIKKVIFKL